MEDQEVATGQRLETRSRMDRLKNRQGGVKRNRVRRHGVDGNNGRVWRNNKGWESNADATSSVDWKLNPC